MHNPDQVRDLLAYSSTIVKASQDFEGTPWLDYDIQFRRQIATQAKQQLETIDASLWTMYFARATPRSGPMGTNGERKNLIQDKRQQTYQITDTTRIHNECASDGIRMEDVTWLIANSSTAVSDGGRPHTRRLSAPKAESLHTNASPPRPITPGGQFSSPYW